MSMMFHPSTNLAIGDPYSRPLAVKPSPESAKAFFESLILSASGWRGVFGASDEDTGEALGPDRLYAAARMADAFAGRLLERAGAGPKPVVALGLDTRYSGPAIADIMQRVFLARGLGVRYAYMLAAPEIMAWVRRSGALPAEHPDRLSAFCYISASHNPVGHNGVKFGYADGGVLPGDEAALLIKRLKDGACTAMDIDRLAALSAGVAPNELAAAFAACSLNKRKALSDYTLFTREVAGASANLDEQESALDELAAAIQAHELGIVAEMNGSARALSLDADFLGILGARVRLINARPRDFAHRIVPEGESLDQCKAELTSARRGDPGYLFGYVPDCDGDRGNIVAWDEREGKARALEAQEGFALAVLAELAQLERGRLRNGRGAERLAVVANDATSMRIDYIAKAFGAAVFRAETGEANVVGLARALRERGWTVRILGEGSNGGVITHPAAVRDPINTLTALLKLLFLRDKDGVPGPYRLWLRNTGREAAYRDDFSLSDVIASLPPFATTSVFEDRAALRVASRDQAALKAAYGAEFLRGWPGLAATLAADFGRLSWSASASAGMEERELGQDFGAAGAGGLKITLRDEKDNPAAFLWMRGSGTEPVFRIMADVRGGDKRHEELLLAAHSSWVRAADLAQ
jgi:phosphoglucomutase